MDEKCHAGPIVGRGKGVGGGRAFVFNEKWRNVEVTGGRWPGRIRRASLAFGRDVAIVLGHCVCLSPGRPELTSSEFQSRRTGLGGVFTQTRSCASPLF